MNIDNVNHPSHYTKTKAGIEVIEVTSLLGFDLGNAFKYLARYKSKKLPSEDVKKAAWYLEHYNKILRKLSCTDICEDQYRPKLLADIRKFIAVEEVPVVKRAFETIYQTVLANVEDTDAEKLDLLYSNEFEYTIAELKKYAETIKDYTPENFQNG